VDYRKTAIYFKSLAFLPMSYPTFVCAAEIVALCAGTASPSAGPWTV